jgi:hypothetical protein
MPEQLDNQITLFIRDQKTERHAFNVKALKALVIDPAVEQGYPLNGSEEFE